MTRRNILLIVILVSVLIGVISHYKGQEWVSTLSLIITGSATSAWLTIYAIDIEMLRRQHVANPNLRRIRHYILRMARNLALWVVEADNASQIRSLLDVSDENVSPQALEMLHEAMKKMIDKEGERQIAVQAEKQMLEEKGFSNGKGLSDKEKKSIRYASKGFLDDLEKISKQVDRVMDYIPEHAERLTKFLDILETYAWSLQSKLKNGTEIDDTEIFEAHILRTYANSFQVCIEIYKITTDAIMKLTTNE